MAAAVASRKFCTCPVVAPRRRGLRIGWRADGFSIPWSPINHTNSGMCSNYYNIRAKGFCPAERDAFAAAAGGPRLRGRPEADPEGMAACGQSLEGFAQMQCCVGCSCSRHPCALEDTPSPPQSCEGVRNPHDAVEHASQASGLLMLSPPSKAVATEDGPLANRRGMGPLTV